MFNRDTSLMSNDTIFPRALKIITVPAGHVGKVIVHRFVLIKTLTQVLYMIEELGYIYVRSKHNETTLFLSEFQFLNTSYMYEQQNNVT